jgi:hypothetical protein
MIQHETKHKRVRAETTRSGLMGEPKEYEESPTLDPNAVRERAGKESYLYQYL